MSPGVPEFSMKGIGERNHNAFVKLLHGSGILSTTSSEIRVSFQRLEQSNFLSLDDLALLTVHLRRQASRGCTVHIQWPRRTHVGSPTRMQKVLTGLRYASLFSSNEAGDWIRNIKLDQGDSVARKSPTFVADSTRAHYLPMIWLDASSFGVHLDSIRDIWSIRPHLPTAVNANMRSLLQSQGFLDTGAVDAMLHVIFMELGWNAILHSESRPGYGFAVFCGQVEHPNSQNSFTDPRLTFCFVDSGRGIPNSLHSQYDSARVDPKRDYESTLECSRKTAIVRFALDRDTTSRPEHASVNDAEGCRGLAYVTRSLEGRGRLRIRSDGGSVILQSEVSGTSVNPERLPEDYRPIPGTQIIGEIYSRRARSALGFNDIGVESSVEIHQKQVVDISVLLESEPTLIAIEELIDRESKFRESSVWLDLACRELSPRTVENICKSVANRSKVSVCVLWNTRIDWSVLRGLSDWLAIEGGKRSLPIFVIVKQADEVMIPGVSDETAAEGIRKLSLATPWLSIGQSSIDNVPNARHGEVSVLNWFSVSRSLNTFRIENGFASENSSLGCFVGIIHLLTGEKVGRYFSFAKNVAQHPGNFQTWLHAVVASIRMLPKRVDRRPLGIVGFANTVRELVTDVLNLSEEPEFGFTILSYDLPSVEELRAVISEPCDVVLLTDVLSTGSTASSLIEQLGKLQARTVAVVSAADARMEDAFQRDKLLIGNTVYPVISCARINIRPDANCAQLPLWSEYWIDPVSMVPQEKRSELWDLPQNVLERIENTLIAIDQSNAVRVGHCVDGVRHMSTFVDVQRLIEASGDSVFEYVQIAIEQRLSERQWGDFDPSHIVAPSGVSRIEPASVGPAFNANVTVYGTAAGIYAKFVREHMWPTANEVSVLRSFDPGGNSRCAQVIENLRNPQHGLRDVVIVDDGMWTGRTISSLLRGVVEAGARRVLIIPLLSRLRATESVHWESLTSVFSQSRQADTPTCFFFPFLFPVPAYGQQDCPFVITSDRIEKRAGELQVLRDIADRRKTELKARTPKEIPFLEPGYGGFAARIRCFLELASEHEFALESVRAILEKQLTDFDNRRCQLILDTFLLEWPLLDRARIRHALAPLVRRLAIHAVDIDQAHYEVKMSAASILRSRFPRDFVSHISSLIRASRSSIDVLEQVVFHVATLSREYRSDASIRRFLTGVFEIQQSDYDQSSPTEVDRYKAVMPVVAQLLLESNATIAPEIKTETLQACVQSLLQFVAEDGIFQHELRPLLETHDIGRDNLREVTKDTWQSYWETWSKTLQPLLTEAVIPRILRARRVIRRTLTPPQTLTDGETEYLCGSGLREAKNLESDIASIHAGLRMLASGNAFNGTVDFVGDACHRVWYAICGSRSAIQDAIEDPTHREEPSKLATLARALVNLRTHRTRELVARIKQEIENCILTTGKKGNVTVLGPDETLANMWVFAPSDIVVHAIAHVVTNLRVHAWRIMEGESVFVQLACVQSNTPMDTSVEISIRNTGASINGEIRQGTDGRLLNSTMQIFEGAFPAPAKSLVSGFETEQSFRLKLWSASIHESLTGRRQKRNPETAS